MKVSLREWIRPFYKKNADTVALQIIGLSVLILLIGVTGLLFRRVLESLHQLTFPVRVVVLLILMVPFVRYFLEGERPERGAVEARARWPWFARHALAVSIASCLVCFVPVVIFLVLNP
jgi:hypothetical protein